jgi:hypothetical protein
VWTECRRPVLAENPSFTERVAYEQKEKVYTADLERCFFTSYVNMYILTDKYA